MGYHAKPVSREMVERAMKFTKSNKSAARFLNCGYTHYKRYAKMYIDEVTGKSLFELHKNQCGKGIPKFLSGNFKKTEFNIIDVIEGRISSTHFHPDKIKHRMIEGGYLKEECYRCGFNERRVIDYKIPLILRFKDNIPTHYGLDNVEFCCYNCYFLYFGNVFTGKEMEQIETHTPLNKTTDVVDFQLDEYHMEMLKKLGLGDKDKGDELDLISRP